MTDFDDFYAAHYADLTVQVYAYFGDRHEAQNVVQEGFCRALARWRQVSGYDDPAAWVRRVAWNLATSRWRRIRTMPAFHSRQPLSRSSRGRSPTRRSSRFAQRPARQRHRVQREQDRRLRAGDPVRVGEGTLHVRFWAGTSAANAAPGRPTPPPDSPDLRVPCGAEPTPATASVRAPWPASVYVSVEPDQAAVGRAADASLVRLP